MNFFHIGGLLAVLCLYPLSSALAAPVTIDGAAVREINEEPGKGQSRLGVGVTSSLNERPFVGVDRQQESLPYFSWSGGGFAVEGLDFTFDVWRSEEQQVFGLVVTPRFYEVKASFADGNELDGIESTSETWFAGLNHRVRWGHYSVLSSALYDVGGESDGTELIVSMNRLFHNGNVSLIPAVAVVWQDARLVEHFYGVEGAEVRPGRAAYGDRDSINVQGSFTVQWQPSSHWRLLGAAKLERLGDGINDSPIVDDRALVSGLLGLVYQF